MRPRAELVLDPRRAPELDAELRARRPGYLAAWEPPRKGMGAALVAIWARYFETLLERFNQAPAKNRLAFLELLGIELIPARAARAPLVFQLSADAAEFHLAAASQMAAPPPPEGAEQIVFETERGVGLSAVRLEQVVSLWPGRDQYVDHAAALAAEEPLFPFARRDLEDTPHVLYLAHDTLLALAGQVRLEVDFELAQGGSEALEVVWEYFDGEVWRGFRAQHPECAELGAERLDGTAGLRRSGRYVLASDCASSAPTAVDGVEASWIRGRLDEPLPADPGRVLPEVERLAISAVIERRPALQGVEEAYLESDSTRVQVLVQDSNGLPIAGAFVGLGGALIRATRDDGIAVVESFPVTGTTYDVAVSLFGADFTRAATYQPPDLGHQALELRLTFDLGLRLDAAFADAEAIDVTKPFYPFGLQPRPGSTFYFVSEEAFSKPGARLEMVIVLAETPQDRFAFTGGESTELPRELRWEYWDGRDWRALAVDEGETDSHLTAAFTVPDDVAEVEVNGQPGRWMRLRLVSGGFGRVQTVKWPTEAGENQVSFVVHRPPAAADLRLAYVWENGPFPPERVLAYNDFRYADRTAAAVWPGDPFQPFQGLDDLTPALYLGFDRRLPVDRSNLYLDLVERPGASAPAFTWEYWGEGRWRHLAVEDETHDLLYPGMVSFIGPADAAALGRFGRELYWLRARLVEDGPPPEPELAAVHPNAVWASQRQTVVAEALGPSRGRAGETFVLRRLPVLGGERLEVREAAGPRAAVEWRRLATEVLGDDPRVLRELEEALAGEGQGDVERGGLRLRRDRHKRVSEVWVQWLPRPHLLSSGPADRHYTLERARGRLRFGDGERGRIPPLEAEVQAREYRSGGGRTGNVAAGAVSQALTGIAGLEKMWNPRPAEGGADAEGLEALAVRGPRTLRHRGRAVTAADFETLALEASAAVAVARALPECDAGGRGRPGWVTVVVIPRSEERRPWPSFGLRERVRKHLAEHAAAGLAAGRRIAVTGPTYREVDVEAVVAPRDPAAAGQVEPAVRAALEGFLHPLTGGPEGRGWEPGRDVYLSDVAAVLERVPGVDYVLELRLFLDGRLQGESARVPAGEIAVAGELHVQLIGGEA